MTKPKPQPKQPADAVRAAIRREASKRGDGLKPIEIVKAAISAYQAFSFASGQAPAPAAVESADRAGFRRGTQASVDRLLFNVNYWRDAYEDRIVAACPDPRDAAALLAAISAWNSHTMKLNAMPGAEVEATFERFCPPLSTNRRRGNAGGAKGPVPWFRAQAAEVAGRMRAAGDDAGAAALEGIVASVRAEAGFYAGYAEGSGLDAFYDLLPAWCPQERIELVCGNWWNDVDVMQAIAEALHARFRELGHADALCDYFLDAMRESIDEYTREIESADNPLRSGGIPQLAGLVRAARSAHPDSETEGYGSALPSWLAPKEQLIWNTVACAVFGPMSARPLLVDNLDLLPAEDRPANPDVITGLAETAFEGYLAARRESGVDPEFASFREQPKDLRDSSLEHIESIPDALKVLGYRIVPSASCYPAQRVDALAPSETECLAFLEHRRWLAERRAAGWTYAPQKDIAEKQSPYLVEWDDLPDRAREWNRKAARGIPALLAGAGLAITR